jgi:hypothetical protein
MLRDPHYSKKKGFSQQVNYREEPRILKIMDHICKNKGCSRTLLIRQAVSFWLASHSFLSDEEKKDLGVS